jgi:tRNA pseudouridine38-40 synthase
LPSTFKITIAYDGTGLVGWQRQAAGVSVQGLIEEALAALDGRPVPVVGAGRTDAGVHALAQVAAFSLERDIDEGAVVRAVNARLPLSVRVLSASQAPDAFHPQFQARSKTYRYRIWNADVVSPIERAYSWHVQTPLDVPAMADAARRIEGRHDFAAFQAAGADTATTEREMFSSKVARTNLSADQAAADGALIVYEVTGSGFLRHMVRNIVGTLVEIGRGRQAPGWMEDVIRSRQRAEAGRTAPAEGLFLVTVAYGP